MDFMFKFRQDEDAQAFLAEIGVFENITSVNKDYEPTSEQIDEFIKSRKAYSGTTDKDKSKAQKKNWRKNKGKIKRGIKAFHKSTEGKKFHRNMGRFLSTRITRDKITDRKDESFSVLHNLEYLKALNSAKQQLYIELDYFHPLTEQAQLESFVMDYALNFFKDIEKKIALNENLDIDEIDFLVEITNESQLLLELSDRINVPVEKLTEMWKSNRDKLNLEDFTLKQFTEEFAKEIKDN
ncbi:MAG: hypothetical protein HRU18_01520 [Pseudoalteromonas sp.]|uniref:hypothetical protein n=1 Tax=Pseudoalteromonas sp. TaxID=53249 RepID=UPI001D990E4F|nr:hypothetical protein [Pseudoalteromonas sp.]NRA76860.1 hypothetical protein [Pseudoalteromonas sp.]